MKSAQLFQDKGACCGCGACVDVCPRDAISMTEDENGYLYPQVNHGLCVDCGLCAEVCPLRKEADVARPAWAWAVTAKSEEILGRSSSGGIAAVLSDRVIQEGGVVYGVAMDKDADGFYPRHIRIDRREDLQKIQGSKYAQSDTKGIYRQVRHDLEDGKTVLFTGTPCQTAAVRRYLRKSYEDFYTLDLICHGVPNRRLMRDFLRLTAQEAGGTVTDVNFRGKSKGQGVMCTFRVQRPDGTERTVIKNGRTAPYFASFLKGLISRESCYHCPYARLERGSDFTVGDFWGFHEEYPNAEKDYGLSNRRGVSCVLVTTEKGERLLERCREALWLMPAEAEKAAKGNDQLRAPSRETPLRQELLAVYRQEGYAGFDRRYKKVFRFDRAVQTMVACVPKGMRRELMKLRGRFRAG